MLFMAIIFISCSFRSPSGNEISDEDRIITNANLFMMEQDIDLKSYSYSIHKEILFNNDFKLKQYDKEVVSLLLNKTLIMVLYKRKMHNPNALYEDNIAVFIDNETYQPIIALLNFELI